MDLWQLYIFIKVIELKSFSRAGKAVHLSQPTISSHIKDLEDHLGCRLIDRLGKEAVATKAGELLFSYAKRIVSLKEEAEAAMAEFKGSIKGNLKTGGSTIPGGYILPGIIGGFIKKYPGARISLNIASSDEIISHILSGDYELAIVGAETSDRKIWQKKIIEDELCLIVPSDHRWAGKKSVSAEDLSREPFIMRESGSGTMKSFMAIMEEKGFSRDDFNITAEIGSTEAVREAVKSGLGVSIISRLAAAGYLASGTLSAVDINGITLSRSFYLTGHNERSASPVCRAFTDFVENEFIKY